MMVHAGMVFEKVSPPANLHAAAAAAQKKIFFWLHCLVSMNILADESAFWLRPLEILGEK